MWTGGRAEENITMLLNLHHEIHKIDSLDINKFTKKKVEHAPSHSVIETVFPSMTGTQ